MAIQLSPLGRMIDFLSSQPTDKEIISIKATKAEEERVDKLSTLKNDGKTSLKEDQELYHALLAEYTIGIAKANAYRRINNLTS